MLQTQAVSQSVFPESSSFSLFTRNEQDYIARTKVLTVGFRQSGKPIVYTDELNSLRGIAPACMELVSRKSNLNFKFALLDKDDDTPGILKSGKYDAIVTFTDKSRMPDADISVSPSMLSCPMVLIISDRIDFSGTAELSYVLKRGFENGAEFIRKNNLSSPILFIDTPDIENCLREITDGHADATFMNTYTASYMLQKPVYSSLRVIPQISFNQNLCIALPAAADPLLVSILTKTILSFTPTETQNIALANTAGVRYEKTLSDSLFEYRLPVFLTLLLFTSIILTVLLMNIQKGRYVRRLEKANRELETISRSKTELMSRVSHEIRTPINAVSGLAYLGQKATSDAKAIPFFRKIISSSQYLTGIINDILDMNKLEGGNLKLIPVQTSLQEIIEDIKTIICPLAEQKEVIFTIHEDCNPEYALCDKMRLEQILINLLTNAVKFTPTDGTVTLTVNRTTKEGKIYAAFTVRDTGCGISPLFLPKLFQPFSQENRNPALYGTGTGLGLAISRNLARQMGGDITVQSEEGKGTVFTATVVLEQGSYTDTQFYQLKTQNAGIDDEILKGRRILLAEDNAMNTEVAVGLLEAKGMIIDTAADGAAAVKKFSFSDINYYDAILMDIRMPQMNGFDASRTIRSLLRSDAKTVPIIAMTADAFSDSVERSQEFGMDDYVTKPIDVDTLYACLRRHIPAK